MSKKKKIPMQSYKHHCRICRKGFACGRALGGHMRAHGVADEAAASTDQGENAEEDDPGNKRLYALRGNPNRQKTYSNDDDHHHDHDDDDHDDDDDDDGDYVGCSKEIRSKRKRSGLSTQEEDLANCLVMLSAGRVEAPAAVFVETEESCASAGKEDRTASFLPVEKPKGFFECKACKKVFTSHQALGGHRASHKKVKGCFAAKLEEQEEGQAEEEVVASAAAFGSGAPLRKKKLHECSVCHRVFTSGQALGGHKRCHWLTSNGGEREQRGQVPPLLQLRPMSEHLDLNLPAPAEDGGAAAARRLNTPALFLQAWMETENMETAATGTSHSMNRRISPSHVEDEAESSVKLAKLSDLKDLNAGGASNSWLQVGLGSPSKQTRKP